MSRRTGASDASPCGKCGASVSSRLRVCAKCKWPVGFPFTREDNSGARTSGKGSGCPSCNFANPSGSKFCIDCGFVLTGPSRQDARPNERNVESNEQAAYEQRLLDRAIAVSGKQPGSGHGGGEVSYSSYHDYGDDGGVDDPYATTRNDFDYDPHGIPEQMDGGSHNYVEEAADGPASSRSGDSRSASRHIRRSSITNRDFGEDPKVIAVREAKREAYARELKQQMAENRKRKDAEKTEMEAYDMKDASFRSASVIASNQQPINGRRGAAPPAHESVDAVYATAAPSAAYASSQKAAAPAATQGKRTGGGGGGPSDSRPPVAPQQQQQAIQSLQQKYDSQKNAGGSGAVQSSYVSSGNGMDAASISAAIAHLSREIELLRVSVASSGGPVHAAVRDVLSKASLKGTLDCEHGCRKKIELKWHFG